MLAGRNTYGVACHILWMLLNSNIPLYSDNDSVARFSSLYRVCPAHD